MNLLLILILLPLIGAICLFFQKRTRIAKIIGLSCACLNFLLSVVLWISFDSSKVKHKVLESYAFNPSIIDSLLFNVQFTLGVDGISLFFVVLTTFLIPACLLVGWTSIKSFEKEFFIAFLVLESFMIIVFCVLDVLLFYVFFESVLLPMFLIIGVWGSRARKIRAAYQFFLYTLVGSVLMLLAIFYIIEETGTTDFNVISNYCFDTNIQKIL
jgi:NADH:ubiquinone oxidoreductase subunit 4 (subunit M)